MSDVALNDIRLDIAGLPGNAGVQALRQQAADVFARTGLPGKRAEDWKYTDLSRLSAVLGESWWVTAAQTEPADVHVIDDLDAYRLVFVAGQFQAEQSNLPTGVQMLPLADFLANDTAERGHCLFHVDESAPLFNGLMAANTALASDGLCACIGDDVQLDKPLYIIHNGSSTAHVLNGLMLGRNAKVTLIEHFVGAGSDAALSNIATYLRLGENAELRHYRLQLESDKQFHIGRVEVKQARDSRYILHAVELGAQLSRADIVVDLAEPGASCALHGLFVASGRQHIDHHTRIDHNAPHCRSRENYRTVLDGRSHAVFNGKIVVAEGAIKTDSAQSNGNLLLSKNAGVDTKPELEIYNDDVKCAHGVTVGQLDEDQLFYLKSRGLSTEEARQLLTFAFADEILTAMDIPAVRRFIEHKAFAKLPNMTDLEGLLG
ncbi:MAG: Fe-S cluster assembly protein SufD [Mariprofundus sp.]|nr:Fe-S cluster assembly protein SufD [Mariprofundus sp.]